MPTSTVARSSIHISEYEKPKGGGKQYQDGSEAKQGTKTPKNCFPPLFSSFLPTGGLAWDWGGWFEVKTLLS